MTHYQPTATAPLDVFAIEAEARRLRAETLATMVHGALTALRRIWHPTVEQKAG